MKVLDADGLLEEIHLRKVEELPFFNRSSLNGETF